MVIKFGIRAIRETFISFMLVLADFIKNFSFSNIKVFFLKQREQIKISSPIIMSKLRNLFVTNLDLGLYHFYKGNLSDAILRFNFIKLMKKTHPFGWYYLGRCALIQHNQKKAMSMFQHALMLEKNYKPSEFYINIIKNNFTSPVPLEVIKEEFEYKAYYYVKKCLIGKNYMCHKLVFDELVSVFGREVSGIEVLDIGCGTGICGHFLKMCLVSRAIDGIDLSENMLKIAEHCIVDGKPVYNSLTQINYLEFLSKNIKQYDAIIAVLVFNYQPDLTSVISLSMQQVRKNGVMIVILLTSKGDEDIIFDIKENIFLFSKKYLQNLLLEFSTNFNFNFIMVDCIPYEGKEGIMITFSHKK